MTRRALVTGASGFTGQYLCRALKERGVDVLGIGRQAQPPAGAEFDYQQADILDEDALNGVVAEFQPHWVFHLAALSFAVRDEVLEFYSVHVIGTENLLRAVLAGAPGCEAVVLSSSANVYGIPPDATPITESGTWPRPIHHYAYAKLSMEHMAMTYADQIPILIARPFNYTGPGQKSVFFVPKIVGLFREKAPVLELGNLDTIRDFTDVRDIARYYILLAEQGVRGEIYNFCNGSGRTMHDVINLAREISGHNPEIRFNETALRKADVPVLIGSNEKLKALVGELNPIPFEQTLKDMLSA